MAASQTPRTTMVSTCTPETARDTYVFKIVRYSLNKGLGVGKFHQSPTFAVGGYHWCLRYFPDGAVAQVSKEYFSVCLVLMTKNVEVRAMYGFSLAIPDTTGSRVYSSEQPFLFKGVSQTTEQPFLFKGVSQTRAATKPKQLEASRFLRNDCIDIVCDVTVITETRVEETALAFEVKVPPSDLSDNLRKLLEAGEETDVTFKVKGVAIPAHKIVLAMRSPVFKEELQKRRGLLARQKRRITIEDIKPAVFKALLHFIYTDSLLPSMDDLAGDLFVAADRYKMERMKMMCADILSKSLQVETVATTYALAYEHQCSQLKKACVQFIIHSNRIDDIWASQAYKRLEISNPAVSKDLSKRVNRAKQSA